MDWLDEVRGRIRRKNQILFTKDTPFLQDLAALLAAQSHKTVALWAFALAEQSIAKLKEKYPNELRPENALLAARAWARGELKMRPAQRAILDCHGFAKEIDCKADIALVHAIGQACSVVHTVGHAMGYPMYELTALVCELGVEHCREAVEQRKWAYIDLLLYWEKQADADDGPWAEFMLR